MIGKLVAESSVELENSGPESSGPHSTAIRKALEKKLMVNVLMMTFKKNSDATEQFLCYLVLVEP